MNWTTFFTGLVGGVAGGVGLIASLVGFSVLVDWYDVWRNR